MNYVFLCEFTELRSRRRAVSAQGGGCHGNGIITRFDIASAECINHAYHPVPWEDPTHFLSNAEPRVGQRVSLAATLDTPFGPLVTYSVHLEVFCGALGRMRQFADIMSHARHAHAHGSKLQLICGDLNTMGHGVARFSPFHCTDHLRWGSLGLHEAQVHPPWTVNAVSSSVRPICDASILMTVCQERKYISGRPVSHDNITAGLHHTTFYISLLRQFWTGLSF